MDEIKVFDSELKVMDIIWRNGDIQAKNIAKTIKEQVGWEKNTTYTVITNLMKKGAIERIEPGFICKALVTREQIQKQETSSLLEKMYDGSLQLFFTSFLKKEKLTPEEIDELKQIIKNQK